MEGTFVKVTWFLILSLWIFFSLSIAILPYKIIEASFNNNKSI